MKIKALMTFKWTNEMPEFKENNVYDLDENLALEMVKYSYAEKVETQIENKMVDTSSKAGEIKIFKKRGRKPKK